MAACTLDLFDQLGGSPDTGGSWTQTSGPQSITISGGHLGTITMGSATAGTYTFSYKFNDIDTPSVVTLVLGTPPTAGTSASINSTEGAGAITLVDQLGGTPDAGGTWTVSPTPPSGVFDAGAGTYDPASGDGSLAGTQYVFTYSVTKAGTDADCDCCTKTATVTVTVFTGGTVGNDVSINICTST